MGGKHKSTKELHVAYETGLDFRLDFLYEYVTRSLKCKVDKWSKLLGTAEYRTLVMDFFDKPEYAMIVLTLNTGGILTASEGYPLPQSKSKSCYFMKKSPTPIAKDDPLFKDYLIYGDLSHQPLEYLVAAIQQIINPMVACEMEDQKWPETVVADIKCRSVEVGGVLRSVQGQLRGKTWLPIPMNLQELVKTADDGETSDWTKTKVKTELEELVVRWSHQISEVLGRDCSETFKAGIHPTPAVEISFWDERVEDLKCIHAQLNEKLVAQIVLLLKKSKSNYWRCLATMYLNVKSCLVEAKSIVAFLKPLRKHLEGLQTNTFDNVTTTVRPLMHCVCHVWVYSQFYYMARIYLGGSLIFQVEPEEGLSKSKLVVETLQFFKELYQAHKEALWAYFPEGEQVKNWDFLPSLVFERYDRFLSRMEQLESLFHTTVEFYKLDKVEMGGSKGRALGSKILELHEEFTEYFQKFSSVTYDCTDPEDDSFLHDVQLFQDKVKDMDLRLSYVISKAFDDCHTPESAFKLIVMLGQLLERPLIKTDFARKYVDYMDMIYADMSAVWEQFQDYIIAVRIEDGRRMLQRSLPPYSATILWLQNMTTRLTTHLDQFCSLQIPPEHFSYRHRLQQKFRKLMSSFKEYQGKTFKDWKEKVEAEAQSYVEQSLLAKKNDDSIYVNFHHKLAADLKEVKYLRKAGFHDLPPIALELYEKRIEFRRRVRDLEDICRWYNHIQSNLNPVEFNLLQPRLAFLKEHIAQGLEKVSWNDNSLIEDFLNKLREPLKELEGRVGKSQQNLASIKTLVSQWKDRPLFTRIKDHRDKMLDFGEGALGAREERYKSIELASTQIRVLTASNEDLLKDDSVDPESWQQYLSSIDEVIVKALVETVAVSMGYLIDHTDSFLTTSAFMQVSMCLSERGLYFEPALEQGDEPSFMDQLESIIDAILHQAALIERVGTADSEDNSYLSLILINADVQDMRSDLLERATAAVTESLEYAERLERYNYIYEEDRGEHLSQFLKYGHTLTQEELDSKGEGEEIVEEPATLDQFKHAIDKFEGILKEVEQLDVEIVFDRWFRLDMRPFCSALYDTVKSWSLMFKQHLIDSVVGGLSDLENFIKDTEVGLQQVLQEGDLQTLIYVMGLLHNIKMRTKTTDAMFGPIKEYIELLKTYDYELPESVFLQLEELPGKWTLLKKQAQGVRLHVAPLQANEVSSIRKRINDFDAKQLAYRDTFVNFEFFHPNCPFPYDELNVAEKGCRAFEEEYGTICSAAKLFEVTVPDPKALKQCRREIKLAKGIWDFMQIMDTTIDFWKMSPWQTLNADNMDLECKRMAKEVKAMDKDVKNWILFTRLEGNIRNIISSLKSVGELQNPSIKDRHWEELLCSTKIMPRLVPILINKFVRDESTTFADLYSLGLHNFEEEVKNVVDKAVKESSMEKTLRELKVTWATQEYDFETHPRTGTKLIKTSEDLIEILEDNQVQLQNIAMSKYIAFFRDQVDFWQKRLLQADNILSTIVEVQRTWCHLESIFIASEDIRRNLPEDSARFDKIDQEFKRTLECLYTTQNVLEGTNQPEIFPALERIQKDLGMCEKALADYLETKRLAFPRFYFVSSADLLDILSSGNEPAQVCRHLTKLFDSLAGLIFDEKDGQKTKLATAMRAKDGEVVVLVKPCDCVGAVEWWLRCLEESMRDTVRHYLSLAVTAYQGQAREKWLVNYPAQVALCGTQIWWSTEVNAAFAKLEDGNEGAIKDYYRKQVSQLQTLIGLLVGELTGQERQKIMTICTIDVHSRDVVGKLIQMRIESEQAFQWQSQLRHRWDLELGHCFSNICDAELRYLYEYLGNTPRLVITPLTDRCYITLTQSLHLIMGGAPAGPAGTGKTETTKDLGRALGIMVYVFNCSEQMDYRSIGSIFKGLAMTGSWGCFDEFNRISVEVLSVVSVQVKSIQDAIREGKTGFNFMGEDISLVSSVGIFITMNPGYAGRSELPENLKVLFRPCAMVVPDFELICEIMLVAEGFQDARVLARKFITLYTLCKELLSKQDHYDWGLRAIKSVLVVAGSLKRGDSGRPEDQVLMRALRDFNIPKIISDDVPVFMGLIGDLFPALDVPRKRDAEFEKVVKSATTQLCLQADDNFLLKVVQLEELLDVRHSVFIVGNAGTGKTMVWKTLFKTYANMGKKPMYDDLNPKAVTNDELFGIINPSTREWRDGIFSVLMREQANMAGEGSKWIVLDGDIDPMWIESLNTVMDDNKVLTLASNERIALTRSMRLIFEIYTLKHATPATVSRAGILYLNPQDLNWAAFVTSWISGRKDGTEKSILTLLFDKYIPSVQEALRHRFRKITPIPEMSHVHMLCHLLEALLVEDNTPSECPKEWYEIYFVFACVWAFGSATYQDQVMDHRAEFSKWWISEWKFVKFPTGGSVFDYFVDQDTKALLPWTDIVPRFDLDTDTPLQATLVNSPETVRLKYFMDLLIEGGYPVMLVGSAGTGKTVLVSDKLGSLSDSYVVANVPFNFYTTSEMLQRVLEKPLEKKAGRNYGPPGNKKLVYFIDDLNMPMVDEYETVQPHTLIRQHMDYGHWYDRTKITLKDIHNVQYVACMNPTAGSFTINPRLQRHFAVFAVGFPSHEALQSIYKSILQQHLAIQIPTFGPVHKTCPSIVSAALAVHAKMAGTFIPTALKFHYIFNLRDLSNLFQGLLFSSWDCLKAPIDLVRLWIHESYRVYGDKLVDDKDSHTFDKLIFDAVKKYFEDLDETVVMAKPLLYYHFAGGAGDAKYMPVADFSTVTRFLNDSLKAYNEFNSIMNLVLFDAAINYVCRISRILESPRGNALLVGVGGSGKQSLSRLAAFLSGLDVFQVTLRKGYGLIDLKADLAMLYLKAGQKNLGTMFLMTDAQVVEEIFLVLINDMLASGEIADLLPDDEVENIIGGMRSEVKGVGLQDTRENCWKFFIDRVRKVLKTVLCFSPVGSTLRNRSRKFPALTNCTSIVWFHEWPEEALISVSQRFVSDIEVLPLALHESIASFLAYVHISVTETSKQFLLNEKRFNYTTPKSFLEQIACYSKLVSTNNNEAIAKANRLEQGLIKLERCSEQVRELKAVLAVQEVALKEKNDKADELINIVEQETTKVTQEKENAAREEANVAKVAEEVAKIQAICQVELEKAEPALEAAYAALNTLNKTNLTELKTFTTPPTDVVNVVAAVFILWEGTQKGRLPRDKSWKATKSQMMGDIGKFLEGLQNLNKEGITPLIVDALKPYMTDPGFQPELIRSKSFAASGLCSYVINVLRYNEVYQVVAPKRLALQEATDELNANLQTLGFLQERIKELEQKLALLTKEFESATEAKIKCQEEADKTTATIDLANRLVGGLASEKIRWIANVKSYRDSTITIPGDMLLVTAFVSYVGSFTKKYRQELLDQTWVPYLQKITPAIPTSENVDPLGVLTDDAQIAQWNSYGLPSDRMSSENATILMNSQRWPLMIDPQLQGVKWIKSLFGSDLVVIRLGQKGSLDVIEESIVKGCTVLIENIQESIDPVLEPLLARNLIKKGMAIKIGDREVDYNPAFRLILQTKLANPHYQPEMQAQTTLINFTVTRDGLEDQLLAEVVKVERPDLERQKSELTQQQNEFNLLLKQLEDDLLSRLQSAEGNLLDDDSLVKNLEKTKKTAGEVEVKAKEATITCVNINTARELYRPASVRASLLYFILNDLNKINPIYQFSLKAFSTVFHNAIKGAQESNDVKRRIEHLIEAITYSVWLYTTRGLFESDKLIFTSQMAFHIQTHRGSIHPRDMDFLLRFPITPNIITPVDFLSNKSFGALKSLALLDDYRNLDKDVEQQPWRWKKFVESESPENEPFPIEWRNKAGVQRLCIMRCLRPDRMTYALSVYIGETLGSKYVRSVRLDFSKSFEEASKETPIFFILSPGVDPLKDVESLGRTLGFSYQAGNFHSVSLGQGQEVVAENALDKAGKHGHWVILQNIHLVSRWLPTLEKKLEQNWDSSDESYRVFLSAEPSATVEGHLIPQGILESSIKITNEAPTGMLANIHKALDNFNQDTLEACSKELEWKAILFSLCYFHAVVAERRKFGTQGWNRIYPFNTGDLTISVNVLFNYLEANNKVPWEDLRYLFGEIMYGGHITDDWDRRLCRTYLEEYMVQELLDGEIEYAPGFPAPPSTDFHGYHSYVDNLLPPESPHLYGLHPNAEIGFLTTTSDTLFKTIFELQPRDSGAGGGQASTKEEKMKQILDDMLDKLPDPYNMLDIQGRAEEKTPYVIVALQECERMNVLTIVMRRTLKELDLGLKGELTITSEMEDLGNALFMDQVPPAWIKRAYPSTLGLGSWFADLLLRARELEAWSNDFNLPPSVWLAGFFNPQSFLTAIMQSTARRQELPLDKMCLQCDVTKKTKEETTAAPKDGACIHGLFMEGARWDIMSGSIADSRPKEMYPLMPVVLLKAITQDKQDTRNTYECPLYKTPNRGATYVWTFNLRTKEKAGKWVLGGVAILLQA